MSDDTEDEDAVLQEQEVMASPDIEPVEELEEDRQEAETEVEEEDRESDEIKERKDETTTLSRNPGWRERSRKTKRHSGSVRKKSRGPGARRPRTASKRH